MKLQDETDECEGGGKNSLQYSPPFFNIQNNQFS